MASAPKITPLPRGTAEGAIVLEVERGLTEAGAELVKQALDRYPGIWGVLLDASEDFDGPGVAALRQAAGESIALLARAEFGLVEWPSFPLVWLLDASKLVREAGTDRELAQSLGAPWLPEIRDLVVELEPDQLPPTPSVLTMLEAAIRPSLAYVYAPSDYAYRALLVQHVASTSSTWSVRWLR